MKTITMIQFGEDDETDLLKVTEWCNEAMSFFVDRMAPKPVPETKLRVEGEEMKSIRRLSAGHPLTIEQVAEALRDIVAATKRVCERQPHQFFPAELKARYEQGIVQSWLDQTKES